MIDPLSVRCPVPRCLGGVGKRCLLMGCQYIDGTRGDPQWCRPHKKRLTLARQIATKRLWSGKEGRLRKSAPKSRPRRIHWGFGKHGPSWQIIESAYEARWAENCTYADDLGRVWPRHSGIRLSALAIAKAYSARFA